MEWIIMSNEEIVRLVDTAFVNQCNQKYGLNKILCIKIDSLFQKYGMENRSERRKNLIFFLEHNQSKRVNTKKLEQIDDEELKTEVEAYLEDAFVLLFMKQESCCI